jgi:nucleoside-diphosphate-sugar epimerase
MIKWISKDLGTAAFSLTLFSDDNFVLDVRDLVDKSGNSESALLDKINKGVELLSQAERENKKLVVCCDYGMSRSNSVAAAILSKNKSIPFFEAVRTVMKATNEKEIKIEVLNNIYDALKNGENIISDKGIKNVLITGDTGFIGVPLISFLEKNNQKIKIHKLSAAKINLMTDSIELNFCVKENNIDTIIHLASPRIYTTFDSFGQTLQMLKVVLNVCEQNNLRLIFPSSWEVFSGYNSDGLKADEKLELNPLGLYGQCKMLCENLIDHYVNHHHLNVAVLRFSPVYGQGSDRPKFIWNFINKARNNQTITTHNFLNGNPKIDLLNYKDAVSALAQVLQSEFKGKLNIGSAELVSTNEVAALIISKTNSSSKLEQIDINAYTSNIKLDNSLAEKEINWTPKVSLSEGLNELLS